MAATEGPGQPAQRRLAQLQAADIAGIRAILVHAISEEARRFYQRCGFHASPAGPMTLMVTVADARAALDDRR